MKVHHLLLAQSVIISAILLPELLQMVSLNLYTQVFFVNNRFVLETKNKQFFVRNNNINLSTACFLKNS
jgi:hypothetical protein